MANSIQNDNRPLYEVQIENSLDTIFWDKAKQGLVYSLENGSSRSLRMGNFLEFKADYAALVKDDCQNRFFEALNGHFTSDPDGEWRAPFGRLVFLLTRLMTLQEHSQRSHPEWNATWQKVKRLICYLGPDSIETLWRVRYDDSYDYACRYEMLEQGLRDLRRRYYGETNAATFTLAEIDVREAYWWTVHCLYDLAQEWAAQQGVSSPRAQQAFRDATAFYLSMLKEDRHTNAQRHCLSELGTDPEREILRCLGVRPSEESRSGTRSLSFSRQSIDSPLRDEAVQKVFIAWFLRRYNLWAAFQVAWKQSESNSDKRQAGTFVLCILASIACISVWTFHAEKLGWRLSDGWFIFLISILVVVLGMIVTTSPRFFRLILPRALFGSLLAWLTVVVFNFVPTFGELAAKQYGIMLAAHPVWLSRILFFLPKSWLTVVTTPILEMIPVVIILLISFILVCNEVTDFVHKLREVIWRSFVVTVIVFTGACLWGFALAPAVEYMLREILAMKMKNHPLLASCPPAWYILILGSAVAVLFGILLQLLWTDKAMTEPLGDYM